MIRSAGELALASSRWRSGALCLSLALLASLALLFPRSAGAGGAARLAAAPGRATTEAPSGAAAARSGASTSRPTPAVPTRAPVNRRVVLAKTPNGYRWKLTSGPVPRVRDHEVLIHVRAVALNRGDLEMLASDPGHDVSGLQVASDAAGDVVAVGPRVTQVRPGMRVTNTYFRRWVDGPPSAEKLAGAFGASINGVLADYIAIDDTAVAPMPAGLSYEEAATLPTAGVTAWRASIGGRTIRPGSVVLIQGTGGVSTFALQFAAAAGARVIQTSSSDEKLKRSESIAPHETINYRKVPDWGARVLAMTHGHGADLVIDVGGKSTLPESLRSLAYGGMLSIVGGLTGYDGTISASALLVKAARAQGIYVGSRADYLRMDAFITAHHLHPVIERVYPFSQFDQALRELASDQFVGKIVLRM